MTEFINWIDITRIIAIFAVLATHSLARYILEWGQIPYTDWVIKTFFGAVMSILLIQEIPVIRNLVP